jgi:aminopeptidase-like protein
MYRLAVELFPICRSITGDGVRQTLGRIRQLLPQLTIHEVPSGTQAFDWEVPDEWNIRDAYILDAEGRKIVDFQKHNLHVVGYSVPVDATLTRSELDSHLYSLPDQPTAIPYVTSYYQRQWGFCLTHEQREKLAEGNYRVRILSTLEPGVLNYGELILPGETEREVLLSTYVCHPSMANNELSGPVVTAFLAKWLSLQEKRHLTYRIVFAPETIGSICYLSRNLAAMKRNTVAGFVITCVGDDRAYSFIPSRLGGTLADKVALHVLDHYVPGFNRYSFLERGSDERQYCSVGVDLPVVSIMRSKYGAYPEYHTSLDDLSLISPAGLGGAYEVLRKCLVTLENNRRYRMRLPCEPQLGKRGLYPNVSRRGSANEAAVLRQVIAYADGEHDVIDIANLVGAPAEDVCAIVEELRKASLIEELD